LTHPNLLGLDVHLTNSKGERRSAKHQTTPSGRSPVCESFKLLLRGCEKIDLRASEPVRPE
jgi:hypothetical protein